MLSQWKLPLFKGLAATTFLKMAINSFLSHLCRRSIRVVLFVSQRAWQESLELLLSGSSSFPRLFEFCCTSANFNTWQRSRKTDRGCAAPARPLLPAACSHGASRSVRHPWVPAPPQAPGRAPRWGLRGLPPSPCQPSGFGSVRCPVCPRQLPYCNIIF